MKPVCQIGVETSTPNWHGEALTFIPTQTTRNYEAWTISEQLTGRRSRNGLLRRRKPRPTSSREAAASSLLPLDGAQGTAAMCRHGILLKQISLPGGGQGRMPMQRHAAKHQPGRPVLHCSQMNLKAAATHWPGRPLLGMVHGAGDGAMWNGMGQIVWARSLGTEGACPLLVALDVLCRHTGVDASHGHCKVLQDHRFLGRVLQASARQHSC